MELDVERRVNDPYVELFRGRVSPIDSLDHAADSIKRLEELRKTFASARDQTGLRRVREIALKGKRHAHVIAGSKDEDEKKLAESAEITEWFAVWLRQPEVFETWLELRLRSAEFRERSLAGRGDLSPLFNGRNNLIYQNAPKGRREVPKVP